MFDVDTLFVVSSRRGDYALNDILSSIAWTCSTRSHYTVVVDESSTLDEIGEQDRYQLLHSGLPADAPSGFHRAAGLEWAIDQEFAYRQVVLLSDTCLIMNQGLDDFFFEHTQREDIGVIGVRDRETYEPEWREALTRMFELKLPIDDWEIPPYSLLEDFMVLSGRLAGRLYRENLLVPPDCEKWGISYGTYVSWLAHLWDLRVVSWGLADKPLPPIYVNKLQGQYLPPPHTLNQGFLVFAPVDSVMAYSEMDLRELFKRQRSERARETPRYTPYITGVEQRDINAGQR